MSSAQLLKPLHQHRLTRLTTYFADGITAVSELVRIVVDHDRVVFGTWEDSEHAARLREYPLADITPCTLRGEPVGTPIRMRAHPLTGDDAQRAGEMLVLRFPLQQRLGAPLSNRLLRRRTLYYELRPMVGQHIEPMEGCPD